LKKNNYLLVPLAFLYQLITSLRNHLFDWGILKTVFVEIPSIGIGNLSMGGTGKTPISGYFLEKYIKKNTAYISRGYGRKTHGTYHINTKTTVEQAGDEAFMLHKKHPSATFVLSEKRVLAYEFLQKIKPNSDLVIFDDVFQHRYIKPTINILLCDFENPFYEDYLVPVGRLRERRIGAERADAIIVTKVPEDVNYSEKNIITNELQNYVSEETPIFFAEFKIENPKNIKNEVLAEKTKIILVSAIANNASFRNSVSRKYLVKKHFEYSDHHMYTLFQINKIRKAYPGSPLLCTEKDYHKIIHFFPENERALIYFSRLKVEIDEEEKLEEFLKKHKI
jgi:tetraacyldisaccharide 4'-kinase